MEGGAPTVSYVDVLLVVNFVVNFLLLRLTAAALGRTVGALPLSLGALAGALGALSIFLRFSSWAVWLFFRILVAAVMVRLALPWEGVRRWAKGVFCLMGVSFLFSGAMVALFLALKPDGMLISQGVFYLELSASALLGASVLCYLLACGFERLLLRRAPSALRCEVMIDGEGGMSSFFALIDTGNSLVEPFSRKPVILCEPTAVARSMPALLSAQRGDSPAEGKIRYIFYRSVGGPGMLPAMEPPLLLLRVGEEEWRRIEGVYVAVTDVPLEAGDCRAILNPEVLDRVRSGNDWKVGKRL